VVPLFLASVNLCTRNEIGMTEATSKQVNATPPEQPSIPSGEVSVEAASSGAKARSVAQQAAKKLKASKPVHAVKPAKAAVPGKTVKTGKAGKPVKAVKKKPASKAAVAPAKAVEIIEPVKTSRVNKTSKTGKTPGKSKPAAKLKTADKGGKQETAKILDSQVAFEGPLFRVVRDHIVEPGGQESHRDVIRHNGSVVILAVDHPSKKGKKKKDPWVVIERQYRHAAGQFLWELPAGKLDAGEDAIDGAKRELSEETGYQAKKWSPLVEYFASPGFLGESMKVFLAEGLVAGDAHPEEDEQIDFRLVRLSELLEMGDRGKILDGKTLTSVLLYARKLGIKSKS
jgi:ADP-ribose pyrophosphatase